MTFQWIPLDALEPHPENSNRMPPHLLEKLKGHIRRTGLYEPLVVRPLKDDCGFRTRSSQPAGCFGGRRRVADCGVNGGGSPATAEPTGRYQILNGHHRARVLGELGHTHARCDVWEVDDDEARLLLATLNRLEGRDDPSARALLVSRLSEGRSAEDLARLLPEPPDAVERLLRLGQPPPAPLAPDALEPLARPMTFFLTEEQHALVSESLREVGRADARIARADALERLALWYLESRNLR